MNIALPEQAMLVIATSQVSVTLMSTRYLADSYFHGKFSYSIEGVVPFLKADKMSFFTPKHFQDASRILRGLALVAARAAADRYFRRQRSILRALR